MISYARSVDIAMVRDVVRLVVVVVAAVVVVAVVALMGVLVGGLRGVRGGRPLGMQKYFGHFRRAGIHLRHNR